jgi:uncharacterized membrane protein YdbT with pleckstrin-like domain
MNQLHPGAKWIFRLNAYSAFSTIFLVFIFLLINIQLNKEDFSLFGRSNFFGLLSEVVLFLIVVAVIFIISVGEIYSRMAYKRYLYEITNDFVKIERGIIWKRYTTIPYERIQNIEIHRGVIARIFNFSTVDIETAGQSGFNPRRNKRYKSEGHLPAVDVDGAEKIREFVMKKIKHLKSGAGLG